MEVELWFFLRQLIVGKGEKNRNKTFNSTNYDKIYGKNNDS